MSTVEGYDLHVYCDDPDHEARALAAPEKFYRYHEAQQFGGSTRRDAYKNARAAGWRFGSQAKGCKPDLGGRPARCKMCRDARKASKPTHRRNDA